MIAAGEPAPDFTLRDQDGEEVSLSDFRGRKVLLVFYPLDFSPVCTDQLSVYQEVKPEIEAKGVTMVGISVDSASPTRPSRRSSASTRRCSPTSSPRARSRGLRRLHREGRHANRSLVLVDAEGTVEWVLRVADPARDPRRQPDLRRAREHCRPAADQRRGARRAGRTTTAREGEALIVYADLGCPHCASAWAEIVASARRRSSSATSRSPASTRARRPCTPPPRRRACRGSFFEMVDSLYADRGRVDDPHLWERAEAARPRPRALRGRPPLRRRSPLGCGATSSPESAPGRHPARPRNQVLA